MGGEYECVRRQVDATARCRACLATASDLHRGHREAWAADRGEKLWPPAVPCPARGLGYLHEDGHASLRLIQHGAVEPASLLFELLAMIAGDDDDGLVVATLCLEPASDSVEPCIDPGDGIPEAIGDAAHLVGIWLHGKMGVLRSRRVV